MNQAQLNIRSTGASREVIGPPIYVPPRNPLGGSGHGVSQVGGASLLSRDITPSLDGFAAFAVTDVVSETEHCKSFVLAQVGCSERLFDPLPGQYVPVRVSIDGSTYERCYAISSHAARGESPRITIKRVIGGLVSNWCHDNLKPGSSLYVGRPAGAFALPSSAQSVVLASAGVGIAPVFPMLKAALLADLKKVSLIICDRSARHAVFLNELRALKERYADRFDLVELYDGPAGVVSIAEIEAAMRSISPTELFACGPLGFMKSVASATLSAGFARHQINLNTAANISAA